MDKNFESLKKSVLSWSDEVSELWVDTYYEIKIARFQNRIEKAVEDKEYLLARDLVYDLGNFLIDAEMEYER